MTGSYKLDAIPFFYILGAPKCGTTALYQYLNDRDDIFLPRVKEPNFFCDDLNVRTQISDAQDYAALFGNADTTQTTGEASVWYLYSRTAAANILAARPDARMIAIVRNPVEMLASLHAQLVYSMWEDSVDLLTAWRLQQRRANGEAIPKMCPEPAILQYAQLCALGEQIARFHAAVPADQRLTLVHDDLKNDPAGVYHKVVDFLGLPADNRMDFRVVNARKAHGRYGVMRLVRRMSETAKPLKKRLRRIWPDMPTSLLKPLYDMQAEPVTPSPIDDAFRAELYATFGQEINRLESLLNCDLSHWREGE